MSKKLYEVAAIIPLIPEATDINPGVDLDSFKMANFERCCVLIQFSAALTGDNVLVVNVGAAADAKTTTMTFRYRLGSAAPKVATADVYGTEATSAALTLAAATYQGKTLLIEFTAAEVQAAAEAYAIPFDGNWITIGLDGSASVGTAMAWAILTGPRQGKATQATQIA